MTRDNHSQYRPLSFVENQPINPIPMKPSKYKCAICGHVYDPMEGDPDSGIAPGTLFEDIPDDWVCPICQVGKEDYIRID